METKTQRAVKVSNDSLLLPVLNRIFDEQKQTTGAISDIHSNIIAMHGNIAKMVSKDDFSKFEDNLDERLNEQKVNLNGVMTKISEIHEKEDLNTKFREHAVAVKEKNKKVLTKSAQWFVAAVIVAGLSTGSLVAANRLSEPPPPDIV